LLVVFLFLKDDSSKLAWPGLSEDLDLLVYASRISISIVKGRTLFHRSSRSNLCYGAN